MLELPDAWMWDFWLADTGSEYHVFYLKASRALLDPARRHRRASIGHARSTDLTNWTELADALVPSDPVAWDDLATWTGSVLRGPDGVWRMYYTGLSQSDDGQVQSIGMARSSDLTNWQRAEEVEPLRADPRWYESLDHGVRREEAWRDPWIYADANGDGWHMITTARANAGPADDRGVIGHARSDDLEHWQQTPPVSAPGGGFGHLEVPQVEVVHGQPMLIFSCLGENMAGWRRQTATSGGIWIARGESTSGLFDIAGAELLTDETFYSGRIIQDRSQQWRLLAFRLRGDEGTFHGSLTDPMPLVWKSSYRVPQVG